MICLTSSNETAILLEELKEEADAVVAVVKPKKPEDPVMMEAHLCIVEKIIFENDDPEGYCSVNESSYDGEYDYFGEFTEPGNRFCAWLKDVDYVG